MKTEFNHSNSVQTNTPESIREAPSPISPDKASGIGNIVDIFIKDEDSSGFLDFLSAAITGGSIGSVLQSYLADLGLPDELVVIVGMAIDIGMQNYVGAASQGMQLAALSDGLGVAASGLQAGQNIADAVNDGSDSEVVDGLARGLLGDQLGVFANIIGVDLDSSLLDMAAIILCGDSAAGVLSLFDTQTMEFADIGEQVLLALESEERGLTTNERKGLTEVLAAKQIFAQHIIDISINDEASSSVLLRAISDIASLGEPISLVDYHAQHLRI